MSRCWKFNSLAHFLKSESFCHCSYKMFFYIVKMPIYRILVILLGFYFFCFNFFQILSWKCGLFQFKSSVLKCLHEAPVKENSKGNPWLYDANITLQVIVILNCEVVVYQLPMWRFWNTICKSGRLQQCQQLKLLIIFMT